MSENELIEALTARLLEVSRAEARATATIDPELGRVATLYDVWTAAARECLRQMRFTLKCAAEATRQIGPECREVPPVVWEQWAKIIETGPIVPAPPGWNPP